MTGLGTENRLALKKHREDIEDILKHLKKQHDTYQTLLAFIDSARENDLSGAVTEEGGKMLLACIRDSMREIRRTGVKA